MAHQVRRHRQAVRTILGMALVAIAAGSSLALAGRPVTSGRVGSVVSTSVMSAPATSSVAPILSPSPSPSPWPSPSPSPAPSPAGDDAVWVTVVDDQFDGPELLSWWHSYNGRYGSGPRNCAIPSHAVVSAGYLRLVMSYETSWTYPCGPGWYTGGLALVGYSSIDQRVTVRFRVVGIGVRSHFIIPMRWPDIDSSWPAAGEEDYCERSSAKGCTTYLHYGKGNFQVQRAYQFDATQWHTVRFERLNHVVTVFIDDMAAPVWTYAGNRTTLPNTMKHVVLQQECQAAACPRGKTGGDVIQIDWITVENPVAIGAG